jgi:hypothetical protein
MVLVEQSQAMLEIILFQAFPSKVSCHLFRPPALLILFLGWVVQWTSSSDTTTTLVNEGLMGRGEMTPTAFLVTSTDASQSSLWVGKSGGVQVSMITEFGNDNLYFTTSVTMQNIGADVLSDVYCKSLSLSLLCHLISSRHAHR